VCVFVQILSAYLKYMTDISVLLGGASSNRSLISQRMQEVIEFEQAIAEVVCVPCGFLAGFSSVVLCMPSHRTTLCRARSPPGGRVSRHQLLTICRA